MIQYFASRRFLVLKGAPSFPRPRAVLWAEELEGRTLPAQLNLAAAGLIDTAFTGPVSPPAGIWCSCPPTTGFGSGSVVPAVAEKDFVSGILVRIQWDTVEPADNDFHWDLLDEQLERAAQYGKQVTLAVVNGLHAPAWLYDAGAQPFEYLFRGMTVQMPVPWDALYLAQWTELIHALGTRYAGNPTVALVHVTHSTFNGFEMQLPFSPPDLLNWNAIGYTPQLVIESWGQVIDAFAAAFPVMPLDLELHPVLRSDEVPYGAMYHAWKTHGTHVGAFAGWWSQRNTEVYPGPWELLQWGPSRSFSAVQFVTNATQDPDGFGKGGIQQAIDLAFDTGIRYLEIWNNDILNPAFDDLFRELAARIGGGGSPGSAPGSPGGERMPPGAFADAQQAIAITLALSAERRKP